MKNQAERLQFLFLGFFALALAYLFPLVFPHLNFNNNDLTYRYLYFFSKAKYRPLKLVTIAVDDYSLNKIPQRWPWKRSLFAKAIGLLDKEGVNTIGIDFVFSGESEEKEEDVLLKEALEKVGAKVVLAYLFDYKKQEPLFPLQPLAQVSYSIGMVNTPQDADGKVRRMRSFALVNKRQYNSFSLELAAGFQNQSPGSLIPQMPLLKDETFFINYQLKPKDILRVSFFDLLENLDEAKQRYGADFLKGALVLIYPEAEIHHDTYMTPLGKMAGGLIHLNGTANIIQGNFIKEIKWLSLPFVILSFLVISYIFKHCGFLTGLLFSEGVIFINFWSQVLLNLAGLKFDFSFLVVFSLAFFLSGSLYKYLYFLSQLLKVKDKATLDPLRGIFTLRYFYYRLELELKKIYFSKALYLVFLNLEPFRQETKDLPLEEIKSLWGKIHSIINSEGFSFWAIFSQDELIGALVRAPNKINTGLACLRDNLEALFKENNISALPKLGYFKLQRHLSLRGLFFVISRELKNSSEKIIVFKDNVITNLLEPTHTKLKPSAGFLEGLDQDIEEKNRQLLSLVENLNQEHLKAKETFFQIIASLANALEARDPYSEGHSERVSNYAVRVAERLGWNQEEKEKLRRAALLHDLGKIGIPDSILHKKEVLTEEEYDFIKKHELIGVKILQPLKDLNEILPWIMYHHEKWDGSGYPHGLSENNIPLASQIISICDVFDALTTGRDYKKAFSLKYSLDELIKDKGTYFNPELVDIFIQIIQEQK